MSRRLGRQPGEVIDRDTDFTFRWDGRWYPAYQGDTISSALAACGERVFSRSFKYHRPRGLLTASHLDPGCVVQIGDEPNVRGGSRPVEPGMDVRPQDVWPSLTYDVKSATDLVGRFLPAGFYYKTFMRPAWLWPAYERVLGRFAHGGVVSPPGERRPRAYDKRHAQPDVLVAGGGPAGMAAAVSAAEAGVQVMLVEEEPTLGGHLRWGDAADLAVLHELQARLDATPGVEVLTSSVVLGRYDDSWVSVLQRQPGPVDERLVKARVGCLVVAPGLIERPYVFSGNDTPGVMLSTAVRRLVNLYAVRPGARAVVLSANAEGDAAAADLARVGVDVAHVEDARHGGDIVRVRGRGSVEAAETVTGGRVDCDLVVTAVGWTAPTSLLNMAGNAPWYDSRAARFRPDPASLPADVLPTGGLMGDGTVQQLVDHGTATGRLAASRAAQERVTTPHHVAQMSAPGEPPDLGVDAHPQLFHGRTHGMVDFSEDVSSRELLSALDEGYSSVELAKRYTTATMGPTQGKLETVNVVAILAEATGRTIGETGTTTWRPPYTPVTLGALAGRPREPVQHSPMQPWHEQHGAIPLMAGSWVRPDHYGDPAGEVTAVRESVGIIDVTPIGKLDLRGPDVPQLLNLLYVNRWSKLGIGGVRYGAMCGEDGVVIDDGVTGRLAEEHFWMSTTSSGAAAVREWVERWLQVEHPGWRVHLTPVTTAYASINVAGPRSRDLLSGLTDIDLSPEAFPYMRVRTGAVARVDGCVVWRIGFTGELSYELHVPAGYGLHVWQSLIDHGAALGVRAFGVEAQRILRLEKGHMIVGQDTDGLTQAFSAGLDGLVKLEKDDFAGRPELAWQGVDVDRSRLVGLQPLDGTVVPEEGCQLVEEGTRICGRVTSSRRSPTLGRSVCLAQVAAHVSNPGTVVTVRLADGTTADARVCEQLAHVDPEGVRLRA